MKSEKKGRGRFPFYLKPGPDKTALQWLGKRLQEQRGKKPLLRIAQEIAEVTRQDADKLASELTALEKGDFHITLGRLRELIPRAYNKLTFTTLLAECYEANREHFDPMKSRPFEREFHYSVSTHLNESGHLPPSLLIGGSPNNYLWAIPMRNLNGQPIVTELLELAPARKTEGIKGSTPDNVHDGTVIVFVIHGAILVSVSSGGEAGSSRRLRAGDYIHFLSRHAHRVENLETGTSALLLIVSVPKLN